MTTCMHFVHFVQVSKANLHDSLVGESPLSLCSYTEIKLAARKLQVATSLRLLVSMAGITKVPSTAIQFYDSGT